jgi:hypothetical protein
LPKNTPEKKAQKIRLYFAANLTKIETIAAKGGEIHDSI